MKRRVHTGLALAAAMSAELHRFPTHATGVIEEMRHTAEMAKTGAQRNKERPNLQGMNRAARRALAGRIRRGEVKLAPRSKDVLPKGYADCDCDGVETCGYCNPDHEQP